MKRIEEHPVVGVGPKDTIVDFAFDGAPMRGIEGEMVSSALFAAGVKSFSIHKKGDAPQGIFCANGQWWLGHIRQVFLSAQTHDWFTLSQPFDLQSTTRTI